MNTTICSVIMKMAQFHGEYSHKFSKRFCQECKIETTINIFDRFLSTIEHFFKKSQ